MPEPGTDFKSVFTGRWSGRNPGTRFACCAVEPIVHFLSVNSPPCERVGEGRVYRC